MPMCTQDAYRELSSFGIQCGLEAVGAQGGAERIALQQLPQQPHGRLAHIGAAILQSA